MRRSYKFRLYPTKAQALVLGQMLDSHRTLYNMALGQRRDSWAMDKKSISYPEQSGWFKYLRKDIPGFGALNFSSAQGTLRRLDSAFQSFFRRVKEGKGKPGYPRFKSPDRWDSVLFPFEGNGIRLKGNRLRVQGLERTIRCLKHRDVEGKVKTISVKREIDKWHVILSCDLGEREFVPNGKPAVGVDVGLEHFLTTSDGKHVVNPRFLRNAHKEIRRASRSLARKKGKKSKSRAKARRKLAKIHARVANRRRDFHHKKARKLVSSHGLVAVEKLQITNMLRNRSLARSISDAAWGQFINMARYKAEEAGCEFIEVCPKGTSQRCSDCDMEVRKDLSVRRHECPHCGLSIHRDVNAARNILALARTGPASGVDNPGLLHGDSLRSLLPRGRSRSLPNGKNVT